MCSTSESLYRHAHYVHADVVIQMLNTCGETTRRDSIWNLLPYWERYCTVAVPGRFHRTYRRENLAGNCMNLAPHGAHCATIDSLPPPDPRSNCLQECIILKATTNATEPQSSSTNHVMRYSQRNNCSMAVHRASLRSP